MIEIKNLSKYYGDNLALSDLNLDLEDGHIYGLLGPNGAGKSTTMNILTGCLAPTDGKVSIDGHDIIEEEKEAKKLIGYLPEQPPLYGELTPREYLEFVAGAKGVSHNEIRTEIEEAIEKTGLKEVKDRLIRNLSKGYKQRVGIAEAIIGNPKIIILDEPTVGLDPLQIVEIRQLIKNLGENHTVIFSSHILSEVKEICDIVMIIAKGKLLAKDTIENLESHFGKKTTLNLLCKADKEKIESILSEIGKIISYEIKENEDKKEVIIEVDGKDGDAVSEKLFEKFASNKEAIYRLERQSASLEDIFIELTEQPKEEKENVGSL